MRGTRLSHGAVDARSENDGNDRFDLPRHSRHRRTGLRRCPAGVAVQALTAASCVQLRRPNVPKPHATERNRLHRTALRNRMPLAVVAMWDAVVAALIPGSFPVQASGPPTVTAISPEAGSTLGGTTVTLTGTNFVAGGSTVAFGSASGTVVTAADVAHLIVGWTQWFVSKR